MTLLFANTRGVHGTVAQRLEQRTHNPPKTPENAGILSVVAQMVATDTPENGCERVRTVEEIDPELARLVSVWPTLPAHIRATIVTLLCSVLGEDRAVKP
jgi:hypothetical protein